MILICSLVSMSLGGIWLPVVSEMRCTSKLSLELPGRITLPELLPFSALAPLSSFSPAEAASPMWHAAHSLKIG